MLTTEQPAVTPQTKINGCELTIVCFDARGKVVGQTGGTYCGTPTIGHGVRTAKTKVDGMIRRGYFEGTTRREVKVRGFAPGGWTTGAEPIIYTSTI